jgi:hypothetical protein
MTATISASIHFDAADVRHGFKGGLGGYATLDIGKPGDVQFFLHFKDHPEKIHAVIAHLVALENEMTAPADDAWQLTAKGVEAADAQAVTS